MNFLRLGFFGIVGLVLLGLFARPTTAYAVSMNFNGHFRSEATLYNNLNLGAVPTDPSKTFLASRALLSPNLVIDDHFSVYSQWSLLTSPAFSPAQQNPLSQGMGSYVFGDTQTQQLNLSRAWFEWTSDVGVFRIGRMPVSWGYGLVWDAGNGVWDDFQTNLDRMEYRLHLGNVIGALAYSKPRKLSVAGSQNDADFYTVFLQYDNPELDVQGGVLYEKQVRSTNQAADFLALPTNASSPNPLAAPVPTGSAPPLALKYPMPLSANVVDVYFKKTSGNWAFGGEVSWLSGTAVDYGNLGSPANLNALASVISVAYDWTKLKTFLEFLYVAGDNNLNDANMTGFTLLHRNRRAGLILGREMLGKYDSNTVAQGSWFYYGNQDSFSGVYYFRPGIRLDWSTAWASGFELIIAQKAATQSGESANLGVEADLGVEHNVYKNFDIGLTLGYLFPGDGLQVSGPKSVFATRATASVKF